jgi:hypothetical protein
MAGAPWDLTQPRVYRANFSRGIRLRNKRLGISPVSDQARHRQQLDRQSKSPHRQKEEEEQG